jgi:hypothetical protein
MVKVGDRVCLRASWLRSTGQYTGVIPHARGVVKAIWTLSPGCVIATIDWGAAGEEVPERINVNNLSIVHPERGIADE